MCIRDRNEFDRLAEGAYMSCSAPEFLREVRRGYETANRINLDFGLKSYMKPGKTFIGFDWEAFAEMCIRDRYIQSLV